MAVQITPTLEAILKVLELINAANRILDGALDNEAAAQGVSRAELYALSKKMTAETDTITKEDMSDKD